MRLGLITPMILTYNEAPNIARTLAALSWAESILVVDSFSDDETVEILHEDPRVRVLQRPFDTAAAQCNFGLAHIETDWVLSMDADYVCTQELTEEIRALQEQPLTNGYSIKFRYCVGGKPLRGSLYPPRTSLYRRNSAHYVDDGHTQRVVIDGAVGRLRQPMYHDDRKPLDTWLRSQARYAGREATKLKSLVRLNRLQDRLRRRGWIAPLVMPFYCLLGKGLLLDGKEGLFYSLQRTYAEVLLALRLLDAKASTTLGTERAEGDVGPDRSGIHAVNRAVANSAAERRPG